MEDLSDGLNGGGEDELRDILLALFRWLSSRAKCSVSLNTAGSVDLIVLNGFIMFASLTTPSVGDVDVIVEVEVDRHSNVGLCVTAAGDLSGIGGGSVERPGCNVFLLVGHSSITVILVPGVSGVATSLI